MKFARIFLALALAGSVAAIAGAPDKKVNLDSAKGAPATPALTAVETVNTAHNLVRYADANKDPLALIAAARILKETGSQPADAKREGTAAADKKATDQKFSVDAILARARVLAGGRADLIALADDVAKSGARGSVRGPARWTEVVNGRAVDVYRFSFRGGELAAVAVSGDGDSDLDLYVYDENGNLICRDEGPSDDMLCQWRPRWTGQFTIKIKNLGVANEYVAVHN